MKLTMRAVPAAVLLAFTGLANAAGFQLLEQNASGIATAYAGSAAIADNASTIFFNPAGMTKLQGREFSLGLSAVRPSFKFSDRGSVIAPATGTGSDDAGDWAAIPNAYLSWAINKDLYVGLGLSGPFGLRTDYSPGWVGRFQAIKFDIQSINVNPSIAFRVNDKVSIGFGVNWQEFDANYERMAATATVIPALIPAVQNTRVMLDAKDDSWGWNAGLTWDVSPTTRIGVSYRSTIKHSLEGTLKSTNQLISPDVSAKADIELPDTFILSTTQVLNDRWTMLGDISWTGWSTIDKVDIKRSSGAASGTIAQTLDTKFRDTWRVALGGIYKYNDAWDLKFGLAWDQTPVRGASERLVSLPDNNRFWLSGGAQWKLSKEQRVDFGAAYLYVKDTDIDNNQLTTARGRITGEYDSSVWILGAQYSQSF